MYFFIHFFFIDLIFIGNILGFQGVATFWRSCPTFSYIPLKETFYSKDTIVDESFVDIGTGKIVWRKTKMPTVYR